MITMTKKFVVSVKDRVMWALCIAAYVLIADWYSPCCIVRADLSQGSMVEERPFGSSPDEDQLIMILANLAIFAALEPDSYKVTRQDQIPDALLDMIAERLKRRGEIHDHAAVLKERDRLLCNVSAILRENHMYHLSLAAVLMKGTLTTCVIEELKACHCKNDDNVA